MIAGASRCRHLLTVNSATKFHARNVGYVDNILKNAEVQQKVSHLLKQYEDFIGLTEVKNAQAAVLKAEAKFMETQNRRREVQNQIQNLQPQLKEIRDELDKTSRGDDRFLKLLTDEHSIMKEERSLLQNFDVHEKEEREDFSSLSVALRRSHEQERSQAEQTKYWSIIGSICGALIGIIGTTINNRLKMRELRQLVEKSINNTENIAMDLSVVEELKSLKKDLNLEVIKLKEQQSIFVKSIDDFSEKLNTQQSKVNPTDSSSDGSSQNSVKEFSNQEWKLKINSLAKVPFVYGALVVSLPLLYILFKN